jgi:hypothetical protein
VSFIKKKMLLEKRKEIIKKVRWWSFGWMRDIWILY